MQLKTEYEFILPRGYVDKDGNLHKDGVMRQHRQQRPRPAPAAAAWWEGVSEHSVLIGGRRGGRASRATAAGAVVAQCAARGGQRRWA